MAFRPSMNLVNKQFNSPIRLYSPQNVQEVLDKQAHLLANGAVGIDFHQLAKPANLSNSAVLRMLEEEEARGRNQGYRYHHIPFNAYPFEPREFQDKLQKDIRKLGSRPVNAPPDWPPPSVVPNPIKWALAPDFVVKKPKPGLKRVAWPPPQEEAEYLVQEPPPVYAQAPGGVTQPHQLFTQQSQPQQQFQPQPVPIQQQAPPPAYRPTPVAFTPPPSTIILRASPPIRQEPPPVYASQPITASVQGGTRSRGDQKWPPESVKQQSEAENEARVALAKGPTFRPRRVKKDYSTFFAQHALNSTYPGYKPPPGTQHYIEEGTSNL